MKSTIRRLSFCVGLVFLLSGVMAAAQTRPDTPANPFANDPAAVTEGQAIFGGTCSACHGEGATGGRGPALNTGNFAHGNEDYDLFQVIRAGIPGTQMPPFANMPADNVWKAVTYIKSLSAHAGGAAANGDAKAGEALFFGAGGCSGCHEVNGRGMDLASDLSAEGSKPVGAIRDGVLHQNVLRSFFTGPAARDVEVTMKDGRKISGVVKNEDSFTLHVEQSDGKLWMLDRDSIEAIAEQGRALPRDGAVLLSSADVENIVSYLSARQSRDLAATAAIVPKPVLSYERIVNADAEPQNWLTYWGDLKGHHFSELSQINPGNVGRLQARWAAPMLGESVLESTPLVVDGIMYVAGPPGDVAALDARSGLVIWRFHRKQDEKNPYQINPYNKGVAVLDGRVFFGTLDNNLIALDAHTGRELWEKHINDTMGGFTITGAPLALKGKIIVGMSGGEMGVRGYLEAYDAATGQKLWRFWTVPAPPDPVAKTWEGDSWKNGSAATWLTGSYDVETNTIIWPVGNPGPDSNADLRKGDNLYSDSVVALDADTGKLKWYYQFTSNDPHDWDSTEDMVLADQVIDGKPRKLLIHANRNGMFYVIDRTNGKLVYGKPFVRQTWNLGFDKNGRPIVDPKSGATATGQALFPSAGTNFQAPSYDDKTGTFYLEFNDAQSLAISAPAVYERGKQYLGRGVGTPSQGTTPDQGIKAIDTRTGNQIWKFSTTRSSASAGLVATRGGLVFAATPEGQFLALDSGTGKPLWNFRTGGPITASPIAYAVDGEEFVAISAGNMVYSFALPKQN